MQHKHLPLISVAVCTYNGEAYIAEQLNSLVRQNYGNLEIVISDDGSSDDTLSVIANFASQHKNIRVIQNSTNVGFNANFERAIEACNGEFIALCDQDDIWLEDKVSCLYGNIGPHLLIFSNSELIDGLGQPLHRKLLSNFQFAHQDYKSLLLTNYVTGHTVLFRRELISLAFPLPKIGYYDWWLGFVALYHRKLTYLPEALTLYRIHTESVIQKNESTQDKNQLKRNEILSNLASISEYNRLTEADRKYVSELQSAFRTGGFRLGAIIFQDYPKLFAHMKPRKGIQRLNFIRKYLQSS